MPPNTTDAATPGSDAAIALGCRCPTMDNARGRGAYFDGDTWQFWVNGDCPVHSQMARTPTHDPLYIDLEVGK